MTDESPPPTPLPPAAQPPYPAQSTPHASSGDAPVDTTEANAASPVPIGALGVTLIGGAVAATVGLLVALPFLRRRKAAPARKRNTRSRKKD